jgi:Uma2 family endonuclease
MAAPGKTDTPLASGDTLTWEQFEERWNATRGLRFAELIGGRVYMPPPLSESHGETDSWVSSWIWHYAAHTPGTKAATNATCRMLGDAPQPDVHLRILEEHGGRARVEGRYLTGAPELVAEVCLSSAAYDLHEKKELYRAAGVEEYIAVLLEEREVRWHRLEEGEYRLLQPGPDGVLRSSGFPGLWLDVEGLLGRDARALIKTLERGIATAEHRSFVETLEARTRG